MAIPQVNGDTSSLAHNSAFIQHLLNYPLISDGIHTFKSNEYGQRSIKLGDSAYQTFARPVIPWFAKPYQYISPYVQKADSIGDKTLDRFDEHFPVVRKPTSELYRDTRSLILLPLNKGLEGRDHVFKVYAAEVKKTEQQGIVAQGKAAVSTAIVVSNETLCWLGSLLSAKKAEATKAVNDKVQQ
ncbi:perilipin-like protein, Mpl1 [Hirsutella rhossiliensis]|uniref:Perilipin-like protein, Mpl1 n=1 Tax=Hirsutella rhossiliensis TaxID=111463 RepID=A0A9P8SM97_9HYPO|nr:perilipin-like protein, Mpl1 [Hirsutella rhossiliensis]KAH0967114.1 perilipin-like protein, Mpl1 [Hirsutella rhossiliensis]